MRLNLSLTHTSPTPGHVAFVLYTHRLRQHKRRLHRALRWRWVSPGLSAAVCRLSLFPCPRRCPQCQRHTEPPAPGATGQEGRGHPSDGTGSPRDPCSPCLGHSLALLCPPVARQIAQQWLPLLGKPAAVWFILKTTQHSPLATHGQ